MQCGNFCPISLLNLDLKLFPKILVMRLQPYIQHLVHPDQVGFVLDRKAKDNTFRALKVIHLVHSTNTPMILLSTDAEKAFDWVDWSVLKSVF